MAYFISDTVDQFTLDAFHARYAGGGPWRFETEVELKAQIAALMERASQARARTPHAVCALRLF